MTSEPTAHPGIVIREGDTTSDQYVKAWEVMNELIPRFADIVRTSAGDDGLQVSIRHGQPPATDGSVVVLPVEEAFADVDPRDPCTCDSNPKSCLYHITVGYLLHEAAHISEGSTVVPTAEVMQWVDDGFARLFELGVFPDAFVTQFKDDHGAALQWVCDTATGDEDGYYPQSMLEVANRFNRHAPFLANAFEDARINLAAGKKRSALPQQMARIVEQMVIQAAQGKGLVEGPLGWQTGAAIEVQLEHDIDLRTVLKSKTVLDCLNDTTIQALMSEFELRSVSDSIVAASAMAEYARTRFGLFDDKTGRSKGTDDRAAGKVLQSGRDQDESGGLKRNQRLREGNHMGSMNSDLIDRAESSTEAERVGRAEYHREHRGTRGEPRPPPGMDEVADAMNQARMGEIPEGMEDLMLQPGGAGIATESGEGHYMPVILRPNFAVETTRCGIRVLDDFKFPAGGEWVHQRRSELESGVHQTIVKSKRELAEALGMNRRSAAVPNLVRGRLHGSKLARVPSGNRRAFRRMDKPSKRSYAVLIGVDQSGSTGGAMNDKLVELAYAQSTLLASLGIPFCVVGHTGGHYGRCDQDDTEGDHDWGSRAMYERVVALTGSTGAHLATHQLVKNFAEPWDVVAQNGVASLHSATQNLDGLTMRTYINMLLTQRATDRILLYYTDGHMPAEDRVNQKVMLEHECRRAKAMEQLPDRRLHLVGIGVGTDSPKDYGLDTILVDDENDPEAVDKVVAGLAERIARTIK